MLEVGEGQAGLPTRKEINSFITRQEQFAVKLGETIFSQAKADRPALEEGKARFTQVLNLSLALNEIVFLT